MNTKIFSIVIPTKDRVKSCNALLDSIAQSLQFSRIDINTVELIIVNDSPYKYQYKNTGIQTTILYNKKNKGVAHARNRGGLHAKGKWIIFFDDDLIISTDYFNVLQTIITKEKFDILGSRIYPQKNNATNVCFCTLLALSKRVGFLAGYNMIILKSFFLKNPFLEQQKEYIVEDYEYFVILQSAKPRVLFSRKLYVTHEAISLRAFLQRIVIYSKGLSTVYKKHTIKRPINLTNPIINLHDGGNLKNYFKNAALHQKIGAAILGGLYVIILLSFNPILFRNCNQYVSRLFFKK